MRIRAFRTDISEESGVEAALPAAAAMCHVAPRYCSRSAIPERLKEAARDDSSDDEWDPDEAAGASDEEDSDADDSHGDGGAAKRGRVTAHYIVHRSSGLEEDDGRRKTLAEKTWARRAVVAHGVSACGAAANFEEVPGREQCGVGDDATAQCQWADDMLSRATRRTFFNDKGIEVRSMDRRELELGLFGNFCERVWGIGSSSSGGPTRSAAGCTSS